MAACLASQCCGYEEAVVNLRLTTNSLPQGQVLHTFQNLVLDKILPGNSCPQDTIGIGGTASSSVVLQRTVTFGNIDSLVPVCVNSSAGTIAILSYNCFIMINGALGILLTINIEPTLFAGGIMFPAAFYRGSVVEGMAGTFVSLHGLLEILPQTLPIPNLLVPSYRLTGNNTHLFRVYRQETGCLSHPVLETIGSLDREIQSYYEVTLETYAQHAPTTIFASTTIGINILNQNDKPPQINSSSGLSQVVLSEDVLLGTKLTQFRATDEDLEVNAKVLFTSLGISMYLAVHPLDGAIFLFRSLYLQPLTNISFELVAQDLGEATLSVTYPVTIFINRVNRIPPQITIHGLMQENKVFVSERAAIGDQVVTVDIEDQDSTGLTLSLANIGQCNNCFNLSDPQQTLNGLQFNISVAADLNYASALDGQYQFRLIASDNDTPKLSSSVQVSILITDENEAPSFLSDIYHINVEEGVPSGASIGRVLAIDPDSGINGELAYTILSQSPMNLIGIHHHSGIIHTIADLDYEQIQSVEILVQAEDAGGLLTMATIVVSVIDRNDNPPIFTPSSVNASVSVMESHDPDQTIFHFIAIDADSGCNGAVEYSILHADPMVFRIDPVSGLLYPNEADSLDFEHFEYATVIVQVADLGKMIRFSAETTLKIQLIGVDDEVPVIDPVDCPCFIMENVSPASPGSSCPPLSSHDPDSETLMYSISTTHSALPFQIDPITGVISITSSLNREEQESYEVAIVVTDQSHMSQPIILKVIVVDANDEGPTYNQGNDLTITVPSDLSPGDLVADISASDADVGYNSISNYQFTSGTLSHIYETFRVDSLSGMLYTRSQFDRSSYTFSVLVFDQSSTGYRTTLDVTINVSGLKNNPPRFLRSVDRRVIPEDLSNNSLIATFEASDNDIGSNGQQTYSVVEGSSNHSGIFFLQSNGGLKLVQSLSGRAGSIYILNVSASDGGSPPLMDYILLVVSVYARELRLGSLSAVYNPGIPVCHYSGFITEATDTVVTLLPLPSMLDLINIYYTILEGEVSAAAFYVNQTSSTLQTRSGFGSVFNNTDAVFVTLVALYGSNFFLCSVTVHIDDINNNPPVFSQSAYSFEIYSSTQVGSSVYRISSVDADVGYNARVAYTIINHDQVPFVIDRGTGMISVSRSLSAVVYSITVIAVDPGLSSVTATITVTAYVLNIINQSPVFTPVTQPIITSEAAAEGTFLQQMTISDQDGSFNRQGTNTFCIASGNLHSLFYISPEGLLRKNQLDFESFPIDFNITIIAYDKSLNPTFGTTVVGVQVWDENEPPVFSVPVYNAILSEGEGIGAAVITVEAVDSDAGINGSVIYSVPLHIPFIIDSETGSVVSSAIIDRENEDLIVFTVTATDRGSPQMSSTAEVHVTILDINDNNPIFSPSNSIREVRDDVEIGFEIIQIVATDRDSGANGIIQYNVASGNDDRKFSLDPWTGSLRTAQTLDYVTLPISYLIIIQASDLGSPPLTSTTHFFLKVDVMDSNDKFPVFTSAEYNCEIAEYDSQFSKVCQVSAIDSTMITYSIVDASNQFQINPSSGVVTPRTAIPPLDRMNDPAYVLHVLATDSGTEQNRTSSAILIVKIIEFNDVPFRQNYEDSSYFIHEGTPVNSLLFFAHHHDTDMNFNFSAVTYGLQSLSNFFFVNRETGAVFLSDILDYETERSPQTLSIIGSNPIGGSSKSTYTVNILDVNENKLPPVFDPEFNPAIVSLQRTLPLDSHVITLNATDPDEGNPITYSITGGTGTGYFVVDAFTGEITTSFSLTSVESTILTLKIRALDDNSSFSLQSWHELTISLSQEIVSKPVFEYPVFRANPSENAAQVIYVIRAETNGKADASTFYAISAGNDDNTFSIDPQTGAISLATTADFDREIKPSYNVTVTASKPGIMGMSHALLVVDLQDADDFRPSFQINQFSFTVFENFPVGVNEPLIRIFAVDEDIGENGLLTYSLPNFPTYPFSISNTTGHLYLTQPLNRSESISHDITVSVIDNGALASQSSDITFTITVEPALLSPIPMLSSIPSIFLNEGSPQGTLVTQVNLENDLNSVPVIYRIINQTAMVSILPNSGEVYVTGPLDYETERILQYTVEVIEGTQRSQGQIARTNLIINLRDINDNRPSFNSENYTFEVSEANLTPGLAVGEVQATDQDSADITNLMFSLEDSSVAGLFTIEASTGIIRLSNQASSINREELALHTLTVSVSDNGSPPLLDFVAVTVIVTDSDDSVPSFHPSSLNVFVPEDAPLGYVVHTISAFDPDLGSNAIVSYELLTTGVPFFLNTTTGDLSLSSPLDAESHPLHSLQIRSVNPNNPFQPTSSNLNLTIIVQDVLDSGPVLMGSSMAIIRENYPTYSKVTQIQSSNQARPVYYSIVGGNQLDHFLIEPLTGTVRTTTSLDREDVGSYQLVIQGAFCLGFETNFELSVTVTDVNDEIPSFSSSFINFLVPENSRSHQSLGSLFVNDPDQNQNFLFVITDSFAASVFTVDLSGILHLNQDQELDRVNKFSAIIFEVYVIDSGIPTHFSKVIVRVDVTDANDPPQFDESDYAFTLSTPLMVGVSQFRIQAVDTDIGRNGDLVYSLTETGEFDTFDIDSATGNVSVINNFMLQSQYSLTLTVTDGGGLSASVNLNIIVRACNFKNLTFSPSSETISVQLLENATSDSVVVGSGEFHVLDLSQANIVQADVEFSFQLPTTSFMISSQTGEITIVGLNREAQQVHYLVIQATDKANPSRIAQAELMVTVLDINDNYPQFLSTSYFATITDEDLMTSDPIYNVLRVSAIDLDEGSNSDITYSLLQPHRLLNVESSTGFIRLMVSLEPIQIGTTFQIVVEATDSGSPPLSDTTTVTVTIVDSRAPRFTQSLYFVQLYENTSSNTPIFNVTLDNSLETGTILFGFSGYPTDIPFSLSNGGIITLVDPRVDYETEVRYNLTLRARDIDSGLDGFATFIVQVLDSNDEVPRFESNGLYVETVAENAPIGKSILQVNATDGDSLPNAIITYCLNANGSLFVIDQMGVISLDGELDYEQVSMYEFDILAEDSGSPALTGTAVVRLQIENINDNPPMFRQTLYETSVQENDNAGPTDLFVSATDPDDLEGLVYSVVQGQGSDDFMISENGRLNLVIANPTVEEYMLNISAFDGVFYGYAMLHISVEGVNADPPRFNATTYTASVSENSNASVFIAQAFATDVDRGSNGRITYSLQNHQDFFSIEEETGVITTNEGAVGIDREVNSFLSVIVMATDGGSLASSAQLRVTVDDINDNRPTFDPSVYNVFTLHNMDNDEVLIIRASDRDIGDNARLTFSIADQNSNNLPFRVRSDTGVVYTIAPPQMDIQNQYEFNVIVRDNGSPSLVSASTAHVSINITADNSLVLSFMQREYSATIAENISFGATVIMGIALVASNFSVQCDPFILIGDNDPFILIDNSRILVQDTSSINPRNYILFISATCVVTMSGDSLVTSTTSKIKIEVLEVNDPPILQLLYRASVYENSTVLPSVVMVVPQLEATDPDSPTTEEGTVEYRLHSHTDLFSINRDTGLLLLEQPLDFEIQEFYILDVVAYDLGSPRLTSSSTIQITVVDINDNPPVFNQRTYIEVVSESMPVGTLIHTSVVTDRDTVSSHTYTISGDVLMIDSESGEVRLLQQLDREQTTNYTEMIVVSDTNARATATLIVVVLDSNDQPPVFNQSEYRVNIQENFPVGVCFLRVYATDKDEGDNAIVVYKPSNDFTRKTVNINASTGELFFKESPDHEDSPQFTLHILATDIFDEMQTFISVIVNLQDVNDNTPIFSQSYYTARISENRPVGSTVDIEIVDRVEAMDADSGVRSDLSYSIADQAADYFSIRNGDIISLVMFDREKNSSFNFIVVVVDMGSPSLSANVSVQVQISDQNDNSPVFPMLSYNINVSESMEIDSSIFTVAAVDADSGHNGEIGLYSLTGMHSSDFYRRMNGNGSVSIYVGAILDHENEQRRQYELTLTAFDDGFLNNFATREGSMLLMVNLIDVDDNFPEFTQQVYTATVPEDIAISATIISVLATDKDASDQSQLLYSIRNAGNNPEISIDIMTGNIFVASGLDYEKKTSYTLEVTVTGGTEAAQVRIVVTNVNDVAPQFLQDSTTVNITENNEAGFMLTSLQAEDMDSNDDRISYRIVSGNVGNRFEISSFGSVTVQEMLDRETRDFYNLIITAEDNDSPPLTGTTTLLVRVTDVNDNDPVGGNQDIYLVLFYGRAPEISLGDVFVNDSDIINDHAYELVPTSGTDNILVRNDGSIRINTATPEVGTYFFVVLVSDQGNTPVRTNINVLIRNITQSTIANSFIMQFIGIGPQEFTDDHFEAFLTSSSDILRRELSSQVDVQILSIKFWPLSSSRTDVTLAVMNTTSRMYIAPLLVQYILHIYRYELETTSLGLLTFTESVDLCSIEMCNISTGCVNLYQYSLSNMALGSRSITYLGVASNHSFSCTEPPASLCSKVICPSPARCVLSKRDRGDFKAECLTDCSSQPCKSGGTCINQEPGYFCQCQKENGYLGRDCEVTGASFFGNSYAIFPSLQGHSSGKISFEFNTKTGSNSLLLYSGRFDIEATDYMYMEFLDGHACLEVSYGKNSLRCCVKSWEFLGDGLWHLITIKYSATVSIINVTTTAIHAMKPPSCGPLS